MWVWPEIDGGETVSSRESRYMALRSVGRTRKGDILEMPRVEGELLVSIGLLRRLDGDATSSHRVQGEHDEREQKCGWRAMNADEQRCLDQLETWRARFDEIAALYERERAFVPVDRIARARELYRALKADLDAESRRLSNSRRALPQAEERWYAHAVHSARGHLRAPTNARPEAWHSDLYNAHADFSIAVLAMKEHFGVVSDSDI
jgi:hypothetical protein